jgi:hypothetical protein
VAYDGTNYLVVWMDSRSGMSWDIYGARVNADGVVLEPSGLAVSLDANSQYNPGVACDGMNCLVVWEDFRSETSLADIYGARVSAAGAVLDASGIAVSTAATQQYKPAVAYDGTNYLVVWVDNRSETGLPDIYGARVSAAGAVLDASGIAVSTAANWQYKPAVAYDGANYLVVWADYRSGTSSDIYGARVSAAGAVLDASGFPVASSAHFEEWPAVASDRRGKTLVAYHRYAPEPPYYGATRVMARFVTTSTMLTVAKAGSGNGTVTSSPLGNIDCGNKCSAWFDPPAHVTLTATPAAGSVFEGWSGACSGTGDCLLSMVDAPRSVTATFGVTHVLTLKTAGVGTGAITGPYGLSCSTPSTGACTANVPATTPATTVTLNAAPDTGSLVSGWTGCTPSADQLSCTVTMDSAKEVTASFVPAYSLTVRTAGTGQGLVTTADTEPDVSCSANAGTCVAYASQQSTVTLHAQPGAGSLVFSWSGCTASADKLTCTMTMAGARSVTATFQPTTYVLTASANGLYGATGTVSTTDTAPAISCATGAGPCTGSAANGATVTLHAEPGAGSLVSSWSGCTPSADKLACTMTLTGARSVIATFQPTTYVLTARANGLYGATGTVATTDTNPAISCATGAGPCTGSAANGATVTLRAEPGAGSLVSSWSPGCTPSADKLTCTLTMAGARSVTATFQPATYVLTARANGLYGATGTVSATDTDPTISCATGAGPCTGSAANGATVTLQAQPGAGSLASSWSGCTPSADKLTCTMTMTAARSVTVTFQPTTYVLTARANGLYGATGTVSTTGTSPAISCATGAAPCTGSVANGATVTLQAQPGAGSLASSWSGCTPSADKLTCTLMMTSARSVTVVFQPAPAMVSSSP